MTFKNILYDEKNGKATIAINRPDKLNAYDEATIRELIDAVKHAEMNRDVGVIVLTGVGEKAFCAGGDLNWGKGDGVIENFGQFKLNEAVMLCEKPTIARVNGYAIGSGNHIAYYCDLTIAAEHAIFGQNGPRVGAPAGGLYVSHSAAILGHKRAREMWMLCRRYTARQMLEWGLVNAVVPMQELDAEVDRWCEELLARSPTVLKLVKNSFNELVSFTPMIDVINRVAPDYFKSGELDEGISAFLEKRPPDFSRFR